MKHEKQPSKVAYFFQYCQKLPGLPRQLKTHIAFSMFPILDTNLWLPPAESVALCW